MNMDEVIAVLQESLRQNKAIEESPNVFFSSKDIVGGALKNVRRRTTALEMAIAALRAQQTPAKLDRSRWEGCKYCETGSNDFDIREICVNVGNYINCEDFDCLGCQYFQSSEYCRRCGKPLTEEAWAELERRL